MASRSPSTCRTAGRSLLRSRPDYDVPLVAGDLTTRMQRGVALRRQLAHAGRDAEAPQYRSVPCASRRLGRLQFGGRFFSRLQEGVRDCAGYVATIKQIDRTESICSKFRPRELLGLVALLGLFGPRRLAKVRFAPPGAAVRLPSR